MLQAFHSKENGVRYRARLELSGRDSAQVVDAIADWTAQLDVRQPADAQAMLECLWVHEEHRSPNLALLKMVFQAEEPRVRAAAIRTLGHWRDNVDAAAAGELLVSGARDAQPLVRAEAVKAAVASEGPGSAEVIFEVATRPLDPELESVLKYARGKINVDQIVQDALKSGGEGDLSRAAYAYALRNATVGDLLKMKPNAPVYEALLNRPQATSDVLRNALTGLAKERDRSRANVLLDLVEQRSGDKRAEGLDTLARLLTDIPADELKGSSLRIERLAQSGSSPVIRQTAYVAWIAAEQSGDEAFVYAAGKKERLYDLLTALPTIGNPELRAKLYRHVKPMIAELPSHLKAELIGGSRRKGIKVDYFYPSGKDVALETLAKMQPKASGIVPEIVMNVPQRKETDRFALRFTGFIQIRRGGKYKFFTNSDDGSRLYIDGKLVVNNDGLHGMVERSGTVQLSPGPHEIIVTYFDNGGGDGLQVSWSGPGVRNKQRIPAQRLVLGSGETLHDVAIRALASIPGFEEDKIRSLAALVKAGRNRTSAISVLRTIDVAKWPEDEIGSVVDNLVGYLSEIPAKYRTGAPAVSATELAKSLASRLPAERAKAIQNRLQNLDVRVIAIGTVPHRMIFDKERIAVQAGKPVEFRFSNTDNMPHNFAITVPGALEEVGMLAEATARSPDAMARHYIPKSDKILKASRLLQGGQSQSLLFEAPEQPGVYPYVCTYPGHWRRMYGALYVVQDLEEYLANPTRYLAANPLPLRDELLKFNARNTEWKFADLVSNVKPLSEGRNYDVGRNIFKVANCVGCHRMNNEGQETGPDLTKLEPKKHKPEYILQSLLEPSKDIAEKYQSYAFFMESGKVITGMIVKESDQEVHVMIDPLAKADPLVLQKDQIEERKKSPTSIMPLGLANRLSREEILDLIAYIYAKGDKKNKLFMDHHKH